MVDSISFSFGSKPMEILLGFNCIKEIIDKIATITKHGIVVVDKNVYKLHCDVIKQFTEARSLDLSLYIIDSDEENKKINTVEDILEMAVKRKNERDSSIIAFGGGIVGNIAGMAAGLLFRGVRLIHIPTTLMAMSDSILSQKQAVNNEYAKNIYGLYHIASFSGINITFLKTLPYIQIISGFMELCKNALSFDINKTSSCLLISQQLSSNIGNYDRPINIPDSILKKMVLMGIESKQELLCKDPYEKKDALILEYGHTVGHAIELESYGKIPHGIAVCIGMQVAAQISLNRGWLTDEEHEKHNNLLVTGTSIAQSFSMTSVDELVKRIKNDNKRGYFSVYDDEFLFVLLNGIGTVQWENGYPLSKVSEKELRKALIQVLF